MNSCAERERFLDGRTPAAEKEAFEAHLEQCPACREAVDEWRAIADALRGMGEAPEVDPPTAEQRRALLAKAGDLRVAGTERRWTWAVGGLAAAVAAALLLFVWPRGDDTPRPSIGTSATPVAVLFKRGSAPSPKEVAPGSTVRVPDAGRLLLRVGQDLYGLGARSEVAITQVVDGATRLRVRRGITAFSVRKRTPDKDFEVEAGSTTIRVVGTRFFVRYDAGSTRCDVGVASGVVEVRTAGAVQRLEAGEQLSISSKGAVTRRALDGQARRTLSRLLSRLEVTTRESVASQPTSAPSTRPSKVALKTLRRPRLAPRSRPPKIALWREWVLAGNYNGARRALKAHLRRAPRDIRAWSLLASCERKAGRWRAALAAHRRLIRIGPPAVANQARFAAGVILQDQLAQPKAALKLFRAYLKAERGARTLEAETLLRSARALLTMGRPRDARPLLRRVMDKHRGTPAVYKARQLLRRINAGSDGAKTP